MRPLLLAITVLLVGSYILGYWVAKNSEPFLVARDYLFADEELRSAVGNVQEVQLRYFGYSLHFVNSQGEASFDVHIKGTNGKARAQVMLKRQENRWAIVGAKVHDPT